MKLEAAKRSGEPVDMEEEFRLLTLQVIGEAVLSLPPEECDRVSPALRHHTDGADSLTQLQAGIFTVLKHLQHPCTA